MYNLDHPVLVSAKNTDNLLKEISPLEIANELGQILLITGPSIPACQPGILLVIGCLVT
jgi:hypothetical protein